MPPSVVLNMQSRSHVAWGGYLGKQYDPFLGNQAGELFNLPRGLDQDADAIAGIRCSSSSTGCGAIWTSRARWPRSTASSSRPSISSPGGGRSRCSTLAQEPAAVRERYGEHNWCQQALLARRLVEAGVSFVTIDLSNHAPSGTWDTHGDNIPPYGGIWNGLRPLLPVFDHLLTTLVSDLDERGLLDDVLVLAMGEFGRTPKSARRAAPTAATIGRS